MRGASAGDLEACRSLGVMYTEGIGVPADPRRAAALFGQACAGDNLAACNHVALALAEGLGVDKDPAQAVEVYQRTCDAGYQLACRNLGLMLRDGRGVTADLPRAAGLARSGVHGRRAVRVHERRRSRGGARALDQGSRRRRRAPQQMVAHYKRGCDGGDPTACRQIGVAYLEGTGLPKSTAAAAVVARSRLPRRRSDRVSRARCDARARRGRRARCRASAGSCSRGLAPVRTRRRAPRSPRSRARARRARRARRAQRELTNPGRTRPAGTRVCAPATLRRVRSERIRDNVG